MKLKFNNGIITGIYESDSVHPDPLRGRIINVSGDVSKGGINLILSTPVKGGFSKFLAKVKSSP